MGTRIQNERLISVLVFIALVLCGFDRARAGVEFPVPEPGAGECRLIDGRSTGSPRNVTINLSHLVIIFTPSFVIPATISC